MRRKKTTKHLESEHQQNLMLLASKRRYKDGTVREYIYSVPNAFEMSGKRAMLIQSRRKREGLSPGVPDFECCVAVPPYTGGHWEMKLPGWTASDVKKEQRAWIERLIKEGRYVKVVGGFEEAWKDLCRYLQI